MKIEIDKDYAQIKEQKIRGLDNLSLQTEEGDYIVSAHYFEEMEELKNKVRNLYSFASYVGYNVCKKCEQYIFKGHVCHRCGNDNSSDDNEQ